MKKKLVPIISVVVAVAVILIGCISAFGRPAEKKNPEEGIEVVSVDGNMPTRTDGKMKIGKITDISQNIITVALAQDNGFGGMNKSDDEFTEDESEHIQGGMNNGEPPTGEGGQPPEMLTGEGGQSPKAGHGEINGGRPAAELILTGETVSIIIDDESIIKKGFNREDAGLEDLSIDSVVRLIYDENEELKEVLLDDMPTE